MTKFRISTPLALLIGFLCAVVVIVGALGLLGTSRSNDALKSVYEDRTVPAAQLGRIGQETHEGRLAVNVAMLTPTPAIIDMRTTQ